MTTDVSRLPPSEFDVLGALELYLWITDADVTKRCMAHALKVMQDEIRREHPEDGSRAKVEAFLEEITTILESSFLRSKKKSIGRTLREDRSELLREADLHRFYACTHTPWHTASLICDAFEKWPEKLGFGKEKLPERRIGEDELRKLCWEYYFKGKHSAVTKEDWLSPTCTYRLFLLYNKLLLRDDTTDLEIGQVNAFLMKMVNISEYTWSPRLEYKAEGSKFVNFPEFVTVVTEYFSDLHLNTDFTCELIAELYDSMVLGIIKKGFLVKRGHFRKTWNRRYFVLRLTSLRYYEDKDQTKLKGDMMLNRNTKLLNLRDVNSPNHPRKFIVTCGQTEVDYHICAEDQRTKQSWLLAIQKALAIAKIRDPSNGEEFVSSVDQWSRFVYGEPTHRTKGNRQAELQKMKQSMSDLVADNLIRNRSAGWEIPASTRAGHGCSSSSGSQSPGSWSNEGDDYVKLCLCQKKLRTASTHYKL